MTTDPIADRIAALIQPLLEEREQLAARRQELIQQRTEIDAELVKVDRVLRAAGHDPAQAAKKPEQRQQPQQLIASPQRQAAVYDALLRSDGKLTCDEIAEQLGASSSSVYNALQILRRNGTIRLAGYRGNAKLYTVVGGSWGAASGQKESNGRVPGEEIDNAVLARFQEIGADGANIARAAEGMPYHHSTVANHIHKLVEEGKLAQVRIESSPKGREVAIYALTEEVTSNG